MKLYRLMKATLISIIFFFTISLHAQIGFRGLFYTYGLMGSSIKGTLKSKSPEQVEKFAIAFKNGFESNYIELPQNLEFQKHDSIHLKFWDSAATSWMPFMFDAWIINYDCNTGKAVDEVFIHPYSPMEHHSDKIKYEYFSSTGGLKSVTFSSKTSAASEWDDKSQLHFNAAGQIEEAWYNNGGASDYTNKITYEYNQNSQIFKEKVYKWSEGITNWYMTERYTYFYDSEKRLLLKLKKIGTGATNTTWKETDLWNYRYGDDNKLDTILYQTKNSNGTIWVDNSRTIFTYLNGEQPNIIDSEVYTNSQWVPKFREKKVYGTNSRLTEVQYQRYQTANWQNDSLWTISYHPNNAISKFQYSFWDTLQENWLVLRDDSLNEDGQLLLRKISQFEDGLGVFAVFRNHWTWINHQMASLYVDYYINSNPNVWMPLDKYFMEFDDKGLIVSATTQEWEEEDSAFVDIYHTDYFNSTCLVNDAPEKIGVESNFECSFANPSTAGQIFICDELPTNRHLTAVLYDTMGRMVHWQELQGNTFSLETSITDGLYILVIQDNIGQLLVKKIVLME